MATPYGKKSLLQQPCEGEIMAISIMIIRIMSEKRNERYF
jgi:hypothetical protein